MDRYGTVTQVVADLFASELPLALVVPGGRRLGPDDAVVTLVIRDDDALRHIVRAPGELGFARAYVSGSLDVEGELWPLLERLATRPDALRVPLHLIAGLARSVGIDAIRNPPPIPPEEIDVGGRLGVHTRARDKRAVSHHYDVGNDFYRLLLGESMTYSCAVFESPSDSLAQAQYNKIELICRKLGLEAGQRVLDVGCGWGTLAIYAAQHFGVSVVGVTLSEAQASLARERVAAAGLADRVDIRVQDYRDVSDGPFDAIASVGMFEHVGAEQQAAYLDKLRSLLPPGGRLLNHQIGRAVQRRSRLGREQARVDPKGFINRYVFPDGALHEVGTLVSAVQGAGLEVRHVESLREHYNLTLRHWVHNLEANWDAAVAATSEGRTRVWRLYLAGSAIGFSVGNLQVHQILAVASDRGRSAMPWRPKFEHVSLREPGQLDRPAIIDLRDEITVS